MSDFVIDPTPSDGSVLLKNGSQTVATATPDGTLKVARKSAVLTLAGGLFEVDVPAWATRVKLFLRNVVPAGASQPAITFYDGATLVTSGFRNTVTSGIAPNTTTTEGSTSGAGAGHAVGPSGSISASITLLNSVVTIERVGGVIFTQSQMMRGDGSGYVAISDCPVANMTKLRLFAVGSSWSSGSVTALFE